MLKSGPFLLLPPYTIKTKRLADTIIYFSVFIFNHSLPNILVCHWNVLGKCLSKNIRCKCSNENWFDFHLSSLSGVLVSFPCVPVDAISVWWVLAMVVESVQVGCMTVFIPPGSFIRQSTVAGGAIIILIFGWKGVTTMPGKRITSSSWRQKEYWIQTTVWSGGEP